MTFEAAFKGHVNGDAGIAAVINDRLFPIIAPQGVAKPYVTYLRINGAPLTDLDGLDGGMIIIRLQIDVYAATFEAARALAELIRVRLQTAASSFTARTNFDQDFYEDDVRLYRTALDCSFDYRIS